MEPDSVKKFNALYRDISACLFAIANALEKSGAVPKSVIAESAQERLLQLTTGFAPEAVPKLALLRTIATLWEAAPNDLGQPGPQAPR